MDVNWVGAVLAAAGLPPATSVTTFGGGTFNTVLRVATSEAEVVVKVAPDPTVPVLAYEHGIMTTEADYYRLAAARGITSVPRTIYHGSVGGTEALVMSLCPGRPWPEVAAQLSVTQQHDLRAAVGRELAGLHTITGPGFGYPAWPRVATIGRRAEASSGSPAARPLAATWREAFTDMVAALLDDAERFRVALPRPAVAITAAIDRAGAALDTVDTPVLVHFDLWDGNILVDLAAPEAPVLGGLIDAERAFWGDPLAELASLWLFGDVDASDGLLAGYRAAGGRLDLDRSAWRRLALYRLYLYLIMWIEVAPRAYGEDRISWLRDAVLQPANAILDRLD
jgi:fructosamine-3-kinase